MPQVLGGVRCFAWVFDTADGLHWLKHLVESRGGLIVEQVLEADICIVDELRGDEAKEHWWYRNAKSTSKCIYEFEYLVRELEQEGQFAANRGRGDGRRGGRGY